MLLLITNRKSYTGYRLALNSMTLDDREHQNRDFSQIFRRFWPQRPISIANCA